MVEVKISIKNMAEIRRAFGQSPRLTVKALNRAIQKSVFTIERDSKKNTPVDTGYLRASHRSLFSNLKGVIEPRADYAIYVHEGTRRMRPRRFLFNAVESNEAKVQQYFRDEVQGVLDDIARQVR